MTMTLAQFGTLLCGTEAPTLFGAFDLSTPPALLFYSYVPIALVTLAMGLFAHRSARSRESAWLLAVAVFFFGWVADILVQWVASYHTLLLFAWQLNAVFEVGLFLSAIAFVAVFTRERALPDWGTYLLAAVSLATLAVVPTGLNIESYDVGNCQGVVGPLWPTLYALEPAAVVIMGYIGYRAWRKELDVQKRLRILVGTIGAVLALGTFWFSNYYGELMQTYDFNLWGPIGMVIFQLLLTYSIVRFHEFNTKVFGAQALVATLVVLIGSELFFVHSATNQILVSITLALSIVFGGLLERSVRAEVRLRERLQEQEKILEVANAQQVSLLHFISHEVKGSLNKAQGVFAGMVEGDYRQLPEAVSTIAKGALGEVGKGITMVMDLLAASDLKKGTMSFDKKEFDCTVAVRQAVDNARLVGKVKGLHVEFVTPPTEAIRITADEAKLMRHVFRNLLDNAVRYTPSGFVRASLVRAGAIVRFTVEDSGVGITPEDKQKLFTEGGHGKDSIKVNVDSTGFGLFIAKQVVDAHGGRIWAESDGPGKGSRFVVELPAA